MIRKYYTYALIITATVNCFSASAATQALTNPTESFTRVEGSADAVIKKTTPTITATANFTGNSIKKGEPGETLITLYNPFVIRSSNGTDLNYICLTYATIDLDGKPLENYSSYTITTDTQSANKQYLKNSTTISDACYATSSLKLDYVTFTNVGYGKYTLTVRGTAFWK